MRRSSLIWLAMAACSSAGSGSNAGAGAGSGALPAPPPQAAAHDDRGVLGTTSFYVSEGTPAARAHFQRGMAALHSFWYDEAIAQFQAAIDADPSMNMAYWGAAMSRCKLLWHEDDVVAARGFLTRMPAPERLTPRERAWVQATVSLLADGDAMASRKRFLAAMEAINTQFPDDESATFLALALLSATAADDPNNVAVRKRAGALALGVYRHNPNHPGAAHYLIHAYDTPELAAQALPYARAYAKLAPAAFHAQHMPAHIFGRLGMWKEAIASCRSAWDVSVAAAHRDKLSADHDDFHSLSWVIEMSFELGRRKDADAAMKLFADAVRGGLGYQQRGQYAIEVSSYLVRTGEWSRVDELLAPLDAPATDADAPPVAGRTGPMTGHCAPAPAASPTALLEQLSVIDARGRAAAARHDVAGTRRRITELDAVLAKLHPFFAASQPEEAVAKIDEFDARRRRTWLARATGDDVALMQVLREAAAEGDKQPAGDENNPSGSNVHEEIADLLVKLGRPKEALVEYATVLAAHPGRAHSLLGAARAERKAGDPAAARARYQQLLALWDTADDDTPGLAEAKAAVAAH